MPTRLRALREVKGLTIDEVSKTIQSQWGKEVGPSPSMLQQLETGARSLTSKTAIAMACFYSCSTDYIFGLSDDPELRHPSDELWDELKTNTEHLYRFYWDDPGATDKAVEGLDDKILYALAERLRREIRRRDFNQ